MASNKNHIKLRINELNVEIKELQQKLEAMLWERKKYIEFSDENVKK